MGRGLFLTILCTATPALLILAFWYSVKFGEYTAAMAALEDRLDELQEPAASEGGFNWFETEHHFRLWRRPYRKYKDASLNAVGDKLINISWATIFVLFLCVISGAFLQWGV